MVLIKLCSSVTSALRITSAYSHKKPLIHKTLHCLNASSHLYMIYNALMVGVRAGNLVLCHEAFVT